MPQNSDSRQLLKSSLLLLIISSLIVRVIYLFIYSSMPDWNLLTVDNYYHLNWAHDIASGNIFGDTSYFRAPFYIYCLAFLEFLFGSSLWVYRIFGMFVGVAAVAMTYLIADRLFNRRVAIIAAILHILFPIVLYFESEILLDTLFMFLVEITLYRFIIWRETNKRRNLIWLGISLGLAVITRPTALVFVPFLVLYLLTAKVIIKKRILNTLIVLAATALLILPITIRNYIVGGEPVLVAAQGGINYYIGNNREADGLSASMPEPLGHNWQIKDITYIAEKEKAQLLKPGQVSSFWFDKTTNEIFEHPATVTKLFFKKLYFDISNREISNNRNLYEFFSRHALLNYNPLSFALIFALAIAAIVSGWKSHDGIRLLTIILLIFIVTASLFFFNSRFRLPVLPMYFILAAAGVESLIFRFKTSRKTISMPIVFGVAAFLFSILPVVSLPQGVSTQHLLRKGIDLYNQNRIIEALEVFRQAEKIDSTFPETNLNIGACYVHMGIGSLDTAVYYFLKENRLHPERALSYGNLGAVELLRENYDDALKESFKAIQYKPYNPRPHLIKLKAAAEIKTIDTSSFYEMALESARQTENNPEVLNLAAIILTNRGNYEKAKQLLEMAIQSKPTPIEIDDHAFTTNFENYQLKFRKEIARAYYQLGFILGMEGLFQKSINHSRLAIAIDTTLAEAYINLANGYNSIGQNLRADSVMNDVRQRFPGHSIFQDK